MITYEYIYAVLYFYEYNLKTVICYYWSLIIVIEIIYLCILRIFATLNFSETHKNQCTNNSRHQNV